MDDKKNKKNIDVLLVEDSTAVALQINQYLTEEKGTVFVIKHVEDLSTAAVHLSKDGIDVILLDLGLPDSDGLDTFTHIHELAPDIPTVVFTGVNDEEVALEALRQGAQDYLVKGQVDGRLLTRAIRYAIERQQAEESLRESEEKHRTLLEAMPDIVYKVDIDGKFKFLNKAVERLGYDPQELLGEHFSNILHPDDVERVSRYFILPRFEGQKTGNTEAPKLLDERRSGDRMTRGLVLRLTPKGWKESDNTECVIGSLNSYGDITATGHYATNTKTQITQFTGTVGIIKDITERRRTEEEKAALERQLQQSQKMEAIGRLAGGVAHDMNNVLGAILGSVSMLETETDIEDPGREDIGNILIACQKGRDLTRDLLGFARKGKYVRELISLNDVAKEVRSLLMRTIAKKIAVDMSLEEDLEYVEGDRSQIHHALMNVCINAADAMEGDGRLTITTKNAVVEESQKTPIGGLEVGRYVELNVIDTGVGMDQETIEKVFEPFFTTKPKGEGTGLGLSMVYGVMKNHGGAVRAESRKDSGTVVTFLLPIAKESVGGMVETVEIKSCNEPKRANILLVDDEQIIRNAARRLLEKLGYTVFLAENGARAVEVYKEVGDKISLVLLDMIMPEMDGPDTFEELSKMDPGVKILLLSGYSTDEKIESLLENGAVGFLQKPFDMKTLSDTIKQLIN